MSGTIAIGGPPKHIVSAAAIVINENNKILLIKGPKRGWEMPGGQVEEGESLSDAVVRETKEESGVEIEVIKICGIFQNVGRSICNTLFLARPVGGQLEVTSESLETRYFPIEEALRLVTWKNFSQRIEYCLDTNKHPFLVMFNDIN
jgi:8-oxo-dGTP diphosphatase